MASLAVTDAGQKCHAYQGVTWSIWNPHSILRDTVVSNSMVHDIHFKVDNDSYDACLQEPVVATLHEACWDTECLSNIWHSCVKSNWV